MRIGAQLYTVREHCQTLNDFAEALKKVADIGYQYVQVSGTCAYEGTWLKERLDENGLRCVITHNPRPALIQETDKIIQTHNELECQYVGLGGYPFESESYQQFIDEFWPVARTIYQNGKLFMYHNHDREFIRHDDGLVLEKLMRDIPAEMMGFTLDTFWVQAGGGDPAQWLERLAGRIPCIHLKDFAYGRKMAPVGEGNINFGRVFTKAEAGGTRYMLVEQDDCYGEDPFDCLRRSYRYLKAQGFE